MRTEALFSSASESDWPLPRRHVSLTCRAHRSPRRRAGPLQAEGATGALTLCPHTAPRRMRLCLVSWVYDYITSPLLTKASRTGSVVLETSADQPHVEDIRRSAGTSRYRGSTRTMKSYRSTDSLGLVLSGTIPADPGGCPRSVIPDLQRGALGACAGDAPAETSVTRPRRLPAGVRLASHAEDASPTPRPLRTESSLQSQVLQRTA